MCGSAEKPKSAYRVGFDVFDIQSQKELDPYNLTTRNAQVVTDHAIDWAARHASNKKFLLWAHYFDPHDPYFPPKPFVSKTQYRSRVKNGDRRGPLMMAKNQNPRQKELNHVTGELEDEVRDTWRLYGHIFTEAEVAQLEELYRNEITYVDFQIGRLLNALQEQGVLENAIVWLVSDHGERLGEDYTWDHCMSLHAREIHVPLVLSVRGGPILDSRRVTYPVSTLDIVPTTLSLLKHKAAVSFEGKDLLNTGHRGPVFSLWENEAIALDRDVKLYFKNASYKITKVTEPSKETPLADTPDLAEHAPLKKSLDAFVNRQQKTLQSYDELIDKLKALGYID
jgi:arylsulfatase A-like enzyme